MKRENLEIYIHIPFCVKKCEYCDFLSYGRKDVRLEKTDCHPTVECPVPDSYVDALIREMRYYGTDPEYQKRPITSVFFGGGTPSLLNEKQILRVMSELRDCFHLKRGAEVTMEANPGTVTPNKLKVMRQCGINRLSLGLQTTAEAELKALGRIHSYGGFLQSFRWAREAGFENINVDMMTALPGQTVESCRESLEKVLALNPEHISAYSLIIEPGTPFAEMDEEGKLELPDEEAERRMYHMTGQILKDHGYERYEISNYAKKGYECRHNIGYWERKDYLGLGLGSSSLIGSRRFSNTSDLNVYLKSEFQKEEWFDCNEELNKNSEMEEFMFLGLRMVRGISEKAFFEAYGEKIMGVYHEAVLKNVHLKLLNRKNGRIYLTEQGLDLANTVMTDFMF